MGRRRTGNVLLEGDHYVARVLLDGRYVRIHLSPGMSEARARESAQFYTDNPDRARARLEEQARERTKAAPIPKGETFAEYLERWLQDRKDRGYASVDHDRTMAVRYVVPHIGDKPITAITREDLERIVQDFDRRTARKEWSWQTASRVWLPLCKLFKDASGSKNLALRVRKDNPALGIAHPDRGAEKSKPYLYPDEVLRLVSCDAVRLDLRRLFTLAVYLYSRVSEVLRLRWSDIDLVHGVVHIRRAYDHERKQEKGTKGKRPRGFRIEPNLLPLLRALYAERDDSGFVIQVLPYHMAARFRDALQKAGIDRPDLFMADEIHKRITFHDLRATGLTWMAVRGDSPHVIMQRAGHRDYHTTQIYIREAEAIRGDVGEPFPPLPACLLGSSVESSPGSGNLSGNLSTVRHHARQVPGFFDQSGLGASPEGGPGGGRPPAHPGLRGQTGWGQQWGNGFRGFGRAAR